MLELTKQNEGKVEQQNQSIYLCHTALGERKIN